MDYFKRVFKNTVGVSPVRYVLIRRLSHAAFRLKNNLNVENVPIHRRLRNGRENAIEFAKPENRKSISTLIGKCRELDGLALVKINSLIKKM